MFREALERGEFVVTVERVPGRGPAGPALDEPAAFARRVRESGLGVHAVSLTDNPGGGAAILPDAMAQEVLDAGLDPLVHLACRDLNRNAFEARAAALARRGIRNVLALTGDYPTAAAGTIARPVFDLDAPQAVAFLRSMNRGLEVPGRKPGSVERLAPTGFFTGVAVSPFKGTEEELAPQFLKLERKIAAGADFVVSQLGYDLRRFHEIRRYLRARGLRIPLLGNVYVLGYGAARTMHAGDVPGCVVPGSLLETLRAESGEPDRGKAKRLERAAKMVAAFRGMGFQGAHLGGFGLRFEDIAWILERSEALAPEWERFPEEIAFAPPGPGFYLFPPPVSWKPDAPADPDPLPALRGGRAGGFYRMMRACHDAAFEPGRPLYRGARAAYRFLDRHPRLSAVCHAGEFGIKRMLFGCLDCGDCGLPDTAYRCPEAHCPKGQRNGPCGGSRDTFCEVDPRRPCLWTVVYRRARATNGLGAFRGPPLPPRDPALENTSGWANFYLGRDSAARRGPGG